MPVDAATVEERQRRFGAVLLGGLILLLVGLGGRLVYIDTALHDRLLDIAEVQYHGKSVIPARRGTIYDARGRVVATSRRIPDVFVDPAGVDDLQELAGAVAARLNVAPEEILEKINRRPGSRFVVVARQVDEITAEAVREMRAPAVGLTEGEIRTYPLGSSMAHVLGVVGRDGRGLEGLELARNQHLSGKSGVRATIRDARRRALWRCDGVSTPPVDGGHLVLTIDAETQRIAEETLAETVERFEAESGVAIVLSPRDGDILALACNPAFDPNHIEPNTDERRRNRAITDPTEPGSTFKPFIASGALVGGFVSPTEQIDCNMGTMRFGRRLVRDVSPHGLMDLKQIVSKSSNIGMGIIATRMGNDRLYETITRFGFGERTGVEMPGESAGVVHARDLWNSYSTTSVSFGYEVGVTPLQLMMAFGALLNDGVLLKPRLIRQELDSRGRVLATHSGPEIVRRVVPSDVARFMTEEVLTSVVEDGSGHRAKLDRYRVLGKTGTAKLSFPDRAGYEDGAYLATFLGAAPADDPELAVLVMIRRPNASIGYYGSTVAAPAVGKILSDTLAYLEVPPDRSLGLAGL